MTLVIRHHDTRKSETLRNTRVKRKGPLDTLRNFPLYLHIYMYVCVVWVRLRVNIIVHMWDAQGLQGRKQLQIKSGKVLHAALLTHVGGTLHKRTETTEQDEDAITTTAEAKKDTKAPLRLMTHFLRAVSENRMEDSLALTQTSESATYREQPAIANATERRTYLFITSGSQD